ncbi:sialidase family protein [Calycomorphotria hydatis]|uniref:exo-alpha-sialidase n=1 Tax=Calycomorphotria hydatis TaxID=2528027 RepID=A0A517TCY8_9PLAN|nr:sialidase family protein [Calycomorphotria hydatis]QDT66237.1 BNR/Asp-box repeat protein [Calycomorphotria hydatis]
MNNAGLILLLSALLVSVNAQLVAAGEAGLPTVGPARVIVPSPEDEKLQHLSWPKVVKARNGNLVVAYSAGIGHNKGGSGLAVSVSEDDGQTFSSPKLLCYFPDDDARYADMGNVALGIGEGGELVMLAMAFRDNQSNTILGWRSTDNGSTWNRTDTSAIDNNKTGSVFGHLFAVPGKSLAACGHYRQPKGSGIWIAYSDDNGKSWGPPQTITSQKYFEPVFIHSNGRLIGLVRENSAHAFHMFSSDDLGETWQFTESAIQGHPQAVHPSPFLIEDPNNHERLLSLVSERTPTNEISLWETDRDTLQWKRVCLITRGEGDWAYPWMTHLGGDEWYLVYYMGTKKASSIYGLKLTIPRDIQVED